MPKVLILFIPLILLSAGCTKQGHYDYENNLCLANAGKLEDGAVQCFYNRKEAEKLYKEKDVYSPHETTVEVSNLRIPYKNMPDLVVTKPAFKLIKETDKEYIFDCTIDQCLK